MLPLLHPLAPLIAPEPKNIARDTEMAHKKDKSKVDEEEVANLSTGWRKSKMSEAAVQELETMGLLQSQAVIQWHAGEGENYPFEGTIETILFRDFMERGLAVPISEFFMVFFTFGGSNYII